MFTKLSQYMIEFCFSIYKLVMLMSFRSKKYRSMDFNGVWLKNPLNWRNPTEQLSTLISCSNELFEEPEINVF